MTKDQESTLRLMLSKLTDAEEGKLALSALLPELEALFIAVDLSDSDWREGFWDSWSDLEINYAMALDMGWKSLDEIGVHLVSQAVDNLKSLVTTKLNQG